jgi:hypothetical protein
MANELEPRVGQSPEQPTSLMSRALGWTATGLAAGTLLFEQSPGNEAVRADAAFSVLSHTDSWLLAGGAVAAITFGVEMGCSILTATGMHFNAGGLDRALNSRFVNKIIPKKQLENDPDKPLSQSAKASIGERATDATIALGIGAAIVILRKQRQNSNRNFGQNMETGFEASLAVALFSGAVGALATGGAAALDKIGLQKPAEIFVDVASNWKTYAIGLGALWGGTYIKNKLQERKVLHAELLEQERIEP